MRVATQKRGKVERAVRDPTDQVITPIGKVDARFSHAGNYTTNKIYCGNLLWQSSLTLTPMTLTPKSI